MKKMSLSVMVEGTIVAAMAMALSFIPIQTGNAAFDLSLGLVPLVLYSLRRGVGPGVLAGFVWGILNIVLGNAMKNFISVPQIIFEYPFAFAFGGLGGLVAKPFQQAFAQHHSKKIYSLVCLSGGVAAFARWFWHYWAGVFVWGQYAPEGMSPYWYSLVLNGTSGVVNAIFVSVVLLLLCKVAPRLFVPKDNLLLKHSEEF